MRSSQTSEVDPLRYRWVQNRLREGQHPCCSVDSAPSVGQKVLQSNAVFRILDPILGGAVATPPVTLRNPGRCQYLLCPRACAGISLECGLGQRVLLRTVIQFIHSDYAGADDHHGLRGSVAYRLTFLSTTHSSSGSPWRPSQTGQLRGTVFLVVASSIGVILSNRPSKSGAHRDMLRDLEVWWQYRRQRPQ